ncbi:RES domain-containing protein [Paraburkholderia sp. GAS199]
MRESAKYRRHTEVEVAVSDDIRVERHLAESLPEGWNAPALQATTAFSDTWLFESRAAHLIVPSVVVRAEFNVLVNPAHPDATRVAVTEPQPVMWDERLFMMPTVGHS